MMYARSCPRCQGDLLLHSDGFGSYLGCLQCGHTIYKEEDPRERSALLEHLSEKLANIYPKVCPKCGGPMFLERRNNSRFRCVDCRYLLARIDREVTWATCQRLSA